MGLPFHDILPSWSTSTPGNLLMSSSSLAQVECLGVEHYRIATDGEAAGAAGHLHHLQHLGRHLQFYRPDVERVFAAVAEGQHRLCLFIVAKHRNLYTASSVGKESELAQGVGLAVHDGVAIVANILSVFHRSLCQWLLRVSVYHASADNVGIGCLHSHDEDGQCGDDGS